MDVDPGNYLDVAQPAIPDLPPAMTTSTMHTPHAHTPIMDPEQHTHMYHDEYMEQVKVPPNPLETLYPNYFGGAPQFEESQYYDRPSFGQMISKPLSKIGNRLSSSRSNTHPRPSSQMSQASSDIHPDYTVAAMGMRHPHLHQHQHQQPQHPIQQHHQHPQQHMMAQQPQPYRDSTSQLHEHIHMYTTQS